MLVRWLSTYEHLMLLQFPGLVPYPCVVTYLRVQWLYCPLMTTAGTSYMKCTDLPSGKKTYAHKMKILKS